MGAARLLKQHIANAGADIVHINWGRDFRTAALAKHLSRRRVRLVYSRHMRIPGPKKDLYHRWFYRRVDRLIVTTREMYSQAVDNLPVEREKVRHLYLGVENVSGHPHADRAGFLVRLGLDPSRFTVGLIGRVEAQKGQHVLVDAIHRLVDSGCDIQAVLIGDVLDHRYHDELQSRINRDGLAGRVHFAGHMPEIRRNLTAFDTIVVASRAEHFGLVLIEAMHAGVAVIGSDAGGVPEIVEHGVSGLLHRPYDASDLADQIALLYHDASMRYSLAHAGRQVARERFSEACHFDELDRLLRETLVTAPAPADRN